MFDSSRLACIWYSIGRSDTDNGYVYSWLHKLANVTQNPFMMSNYSEWELDRGPSRKTMYVTALYFTMTCMTSVGFGNVAAETDNEKIFTICMMIIAGKRLRDQAFVPLPKKRREDIKSVSITFL
jgi:hypothetical protein